MTNDPSPWRREPPPPAPPPPRNRLVLWLLIAAAIGGLVLALARAFPEARLAGGEQVFAVSGLDVTILRPSVVFGEGDKLLNTFAQLQQAFPVMPLACADAQFQPVWVEDVAQAVVSSLTINYQINSTLRNQYAGKVPKTFEIAGPAKYSLRELVALAGRCVGAERPIIALPNALARLQAAVMENLPGPTLMSRDNLASMQSPNVASDQLPGLKELGIEASSITAIAPLYLKPKSPMNTLRKGASR